jgi:hypothetical protein
LRLFLAVARLPEGGFTRCAAAALLLRAVARRRRVSRARDVLQSLRRAQGAPMNTVETTLAIRARLREHVLPRGGLWRQLGEYSGGGVCGACGERITSAQASYAVDFTPGVTPASVRFHRVCLEIWQCECRTPRSS